MAASGKVCSLLALLLVASSTIVSAVDIIFYSSRTACGGSGYSFNGIARQVCCIANGGSVLFTDMNSCKTSRVYRNRGCDTNPVGSGTGNRCYVGGGFTSGYWYQSCRRRSLLDLGDEVPMASDKDCLTKPTGLVYTDDSTKGNWILDIPNVYDLMKDFEGLSDEEKLNWIKSHGARYVSYAAH